MHLFNVILMGYNFCIPSALQRPFNFCLINKHNSLLNIACIIVSVSSELILYFDIMFMYKIVNKIIAVDFGYNNNLPEVLYATTTLHLISTNARYLNRYLRIGTRSI